MTPAKKTPFGNRLTLSSSPYLRQHAQNPVDWFPWGAQAFAAAKAQDKPIFLSIGYSTCHWCHVMAHESFEDPAVAAILNQYFVAVKVDREERPDIDNVYITACQLVRGSAGWPLTVLVLPDGRPFFVATYLAKASSQGRLGLVDLLEHIAAEWRADRTEFFEAASEITSAVHSALRPEWLEPVSLADAKDEAMFNLLRDLDPEHGGFGRQPKFPVPQKLLLLLSAGRNADPQLFEAVRLTLDAMARSGLHDHLSGGFHRYATDRQWKLPHFEKMLYDQAMLLWVYAEAFSSIGDPAYRATAESTARYMLRDLALPGGCLGSGEDADSDGEEGRFYLWSLSELRAVLSEAELTLVTQLFAISETGNYIDERSNRATGLNVLHQQVALSQVAEQMRLSVMEAEDLRNEAYAALETQRQARTRPQRDEKALTDWNGLAALALTKAGRLLGHRDLVEAGARLAGTVLATARSIDGRLSHTGIPGQPGFLDDYAWMALACLELFEATDQVQWRQEAESLAAQLAELFADPATGALSLTAKDGESLFARPMNVMDGALPSGYSAAVHALRRISASTGRAELRRLADRALGPLSRTLAVAPEEHALVLLT